MPRIGTPLSPSATRVLLCGSGELGKEVVIELQRLGVEVIAVDRYPNAPAMQVAHRSHVIDMLDGAALRAVIEQERPHYIVPEIEAIATSTLVELEAEGFTVIPTARAAQLTMNREGIRRLAAEELGLPTSPYHFADSFEEYRQAVEKLGFPCVVKPIMSSSGKGQSLLRGPEDVQKAWDYAQEGGRAGRGRVIVEGFIDFDYEITLLTVRHAGGTTFCAPIGHRQEKGDYQESWQPQAMSARALAESERIASAVTEALGGRGLFGVELFVKGDQVWFSEVSPRPHDTGLVTLISQDLSEFALHARAILGLPIPAIRQFGPSASAVILVAGQSRQASFGNLQAALAEPDTALRLFGKPEVAGQRRMGVALAAGAAQGLAAAAEQSGTPLRLLVLGESTVAGVGAACLEQALAGQLAVALARRLARPVQWQALGENGITAGEACRRLLPQVGERFDLVVLVFGVNDTTHFTSAAAWRAALAQLIERFRGQGAAVLCTGVPPLEHFHALPWLLRQLLGWRARLLDAQLRAQAQDSGARYCGLSLAMRREFLAIDGYHPSTLGYRVWAEGLAEVAAALYPGR